MNFRWLTISLLFLIFGQSVSAVHHHLEWEHNESPHACCLCVLTCALAVVATYEHGPLVVEKYMQNLNWGVDQSVQGYCCSTNGAWPCDRRPVIWAFDIDRCAHMQDAQIKLLQRANQTEYLSSKRKMQ